MSISANMSNETDHTGHVDLYCRDLPSGPLVWTVSSILCTLTGLPASLWLLWVLSRKGCSGMSKDVYRLNLTIMDLIFTTCNVPSIVNYFVWRAEWLSRASDMSYSLSFSGRPLFTACICVDCYLAVVHPISYMKMKHGRYRRVACALVWALTLTYGVMFVYNANGNFSVLVIPFALSLPTITFCDVAILRALRKPDPSGRSDVHPQKQRALQTITNSLIITVVAYLPPTVVFSFSSLMPLSILQLYCNVLSPMLVAPLLGSVIMPLLHLQNLGYLKTCYKCW